MNWRAVHAIVRRDLLRVVRSKGVMLPMILVPLIIMVLLPGGLSYFIPRLSEIPGAATTDVQAYLARMPEPFLAQLGDYNENQLMVVLFTVYMFAPMYLILPLMVASVIASDSFAGEKERKTLEALIYTPTTDVELFVGKVFSAWVPALVVSLVGFALYTVSVNLGGWQTMGRIFFPTAMWWVLVVWVAPAAAGMGLGATVLVSSRVSTFQEANQIAGAIVLPIVLLVLGQATGAMYLSVGFVFLLGVLFWIIDAVLLWFGIRTFQRDEIIARL
ncbi:MAG: ABC transporter permease subunit [Anaerolineae bacterium]|nr:ABC transporter permease subunit [Anaerolineae bacterium]